MNIAIVVAEFNSEVTAKMLNLAIEKAKELKIKVNYTCKVPGVFDMPLMVDKLLQSRYDFQ